MLKANQIRLLKKIGMAFLATVLCILLVFNAGIVECFAFAVIDDATALLLLLATVCAACGVTFSSIESAEAGTNALYNNMDSSTQMACEGVASSIKNKTSSDTLLLRTGVRFLADEWSKILTAVVATFGTYEAINTITNLSDPTFTGVTSTTPFKYATACNESSVCQYQINNMTHTIIGCKSTGYTVPSFVELSDSKYTEFISIADGVFGAYWSEWGGSTLNITQSVRYSGNYLVFGSSVHNFSDSLYFNGSKLVKEMTNNGFALTANGINIVQDGYIMGTSIPVAPGICPDGIWTEKTFSDWLNDLIFGNTIPGNPGIDAVSYPGNDTWHDGSINDDVSIGGNPTIGISVPTTKDAITSLNPDVARDYSNTDVKVDTDVNTDTDVDTDTGTGTGTSTSTPNSKPGSLPALSLPEILFKEKFPFCLPWDLYNLFACLLADPVAPKFTIPFEIPRLGIEESITIDFSEFEEQVQIVRFFLGASFVLALILISRKMIGAG